MFDKTKMNIYLKMNL